jgi:hypothetical protein
MVLLCSVGFLSVSAGNTSPAGAEHSRCHAHQELKEQLYREKFVDQAGGDPRQAAKLICISRGYSALDRKCEEWEEKILRQQMMQLQNAIAKDCR